MSASAPPGAVPWYLRWYKRLQVAMLATGCARYDRSVEPLKRELLAPLRGRVLEIGPGAGANLPYYASGITWIGVEPNPYAHDALRREAERRGLRAELHAGVAERLPVGDASVDAVVSTLVLCTVPDVPGALAEVRRVLRPGGRFVFIEHVAAEPGTRTRRLQRLVKPAWRVLADGCHPDRDTAAAIERAGFTSVTLRRLRMPVPVVGPHVAGVAVMGEES